MTNTNLRVIVAGLVVTAATVGLYAIEAPLWLLALVSVVGSLSMIAWAFDE
jgi:hypothetical protein